MIFIALEFVASLTGSPVETKPAISQKYNLKPDLADTLETS